MQKLYRFEHNYLTTPSSTGRKPAYPCSDGVASIRGKSVKGTLSVKRSKLCTFAALAFAFGSKNGLRVDEAADVLIGLLAKADIEIYDGLCAGLPQPLPDYDNVDEFNGVEMSRGEYIVEYGFNSRWWDERSQNNAYKAFAFLVDKDTAMLLFNLEEIPDVNENSFRGIHTRVGEEPLNPPTPSTPPTPPTPSAPPTVQAEIVGHRHEQDQNKSDRLVKLNQASTKFWSNADRNDRTTHPDNQRVADWLVKEGFSQTLADKAATIIRPEWAGTGRRPDK